MTLVIKTIVNFEYDRIVYVSINNILFLNL